MKYSLLIIVVKYYLYYMLPNFLMKISIKVLIYLQYLNIGIALGKTSKYIKSSLPPVVLLWCQCTLQCPKPQLFFTSFHVQHVCTSRKPNFISSFYLTVDISHRDTYSSAILTFQSLSSAILKEFQSTGQKVF